MEVFFAGDGYPSSCQYIFNEGFSRLLSFVNQRPWAERYILNKHREVFMADFALYLAGDSSGFPDAVPEKLIMEYNVLMSYIHPKGKEGVDKIGKVVRQEMIDLYLAGSDKSGNERREAWMDLFLVGPEKEEIMASTMSGDNKSNMLFNYLDGKRAADRYKEAIKPKKLFIDSGAFSAWTKGKVIDVDEYIAWINDRADYIDLCGQIDVIPGDIVKGHTYEQVVEAAGKTWENYLYMRPKMKKPESLLYTFHVGEPYEYLARALEWRDPEGKLIPYIALGGMVGKPMPVKRAFLDACFNVIKKSSNPNVKVHAFGMTSFDILGAYPITSADSTSWIMTGANGNIMTDAGIVAVSDQMSKLPEHYSHLPKDLQEAFNRSISEFGFTLDELRHSRDKRIMHNARWMNKQAAAVEYKPSVNKRTSLF